MTKPTCSTCPFFVRNAQAALDQPGTCGLEPGRMFPLMVPKDGQLVPQVVTARPNAFHHETCQHHPLMDAWLDQFIDAHEPANGQADEPVSPWMMTAHGDK